MRLAPAAAVTLTVAAISRATRRMLNQPPGDTLKQQARKHFFFEKKKQKTFVCWYAAQNECVHFGTQKLAKFFAKRA
jgi:hypothetical protein